MGNKPKPKPRKPPTDVDGLLAAHSAGLQASNEAPSWELRERLRHSWYSDEEVTPTPEEEAAAANRAALHALTEQINLNRQKGPNYTSARRRKAGQAAAKAARLGRKGGAK